MKSLVVLLLSSTVISLTTTTNFEDAYNPAATEIVVRAPWYEDKQGNIVINQGWLETFYEQNDDPLRESSPECRQSLKDAPPDSAIICIKKRQDKPVNEKTPDLFGALKRAFP